jgi:sterol desaturase/sphingolipid hydroxylase (fatty acid hydroxylase superfamily)
MPPAVVFALVLAALHAGSASRHGFHHLHANDGCYGSFLGLWDTLLGTDRAWRAETGS